MRGTDTRPLTAQTTVSKFLILAIVVVLFSTFFVAQHQMHYSKGGQDRYSAGSAITSGDFERRIMFVSMGIFFFFLLFREKRFPFEFRGGLYWIVLFYICWTFISVIWADEISLVARRLVVFAIFCISAFSISLNMPLWRLASVVLWVNLFFLLTGIYSEITAGTFSIFSQGYRFAGTYHPASQAVNCAMLFLAAMITARYDNRSMRKFSYFIMFLAIFFLLLTRSRGPSVGVLIAFFVCKFYSAERSKVLTYLYVMLLITCIAFLILGSTFGPVVGEGILLGRQGEEFKSLTGRLPLWIECMNYVKASPIFGYGFGGFWTEERLLAISDSHSWTVNSSHSAYFETVLNLGLVGLAIFLTMVITAWWTARRGLRFRREDGMAFALGLLTLWLADGLLSTSISGRGFVPFLALVVLFGVARENAEWKRFNRDRDSRVSSADEYIKGREWKL